MSFRIAVDTGGTFSDVVVADAAGGELRVSKAPTTPHRVFDGISEALGYGASELGLELAQLLGQTGVHLRHHQSDERDPDRDHGADRVHDHRRLPRHAGVPRGREAPPVRLPPRSIPTPYVPRRLTFEVPERVDSEGEIVPSRSTRARPCDAQRRAERRAWRRSRCACCGRSSTRSHEERVGELIEPSCRASRTRCPPAEPDHPRVPARVVDRDRRLAEAADAGHLAEMTATCGTRASPASCWSVTSVGGVLDARTWPSARSTRSTRAPAMAPVAGRVVRGATGSARRDRLRHRRHQLRRQPRARTAHPASPARPGWGSRSPGT